MNKIVIYKEGEYQSLPMTESLFWNRVDSLKKALLNSEDFEFRLMWYHKLQELLKKSTMIFFLMIWPILLYFFIMTILLLL